MSAGEVLKYYPDAKPIKVKNHYEIINHGTVLGKGKNKKCAWKSADRNISK
jgi:hypothetical protein